MVEERRPRSGDADPYMLLGVARDAAPSEIRWAYERLLNQASKNGSITRATELTRAYDVLSNPARRRIFDQYGVAPEYDRAPRGHEARPTPWRAPTTDLVTGLGSPSPPVRRPSPRRTRRTPVTAVFLIGVLAGLALAGYLYQQSQRARGPAAPTQSSRLVLCQAPPGGAGYTYSAPPGAPLSCRNGATPRVVSP